MSLLAPTASELTPEAAAGRQPTRAVRSFAWPACWLVLATLLLATADEVSLGQINTLTTLFALVAIAQAWNILAGFGGQLSLGVAAFTGTGGYAVTLSMLHAQLSLLPAMGIGAVAGALLAAIVSPAVFRLRGPYFAVGTLGLALAIQAWMENWSYSGATQPLSLPFAGIPSQQGMYRIAVVIAGITMLAAWLVRRSEFGLRLMAVRDNERAARSLGVGAFRVKSLAFIITGCLTALAGGLIAAQSGSIEPVSAFGPGFTIDAVVMTVIGGLGTLVGPVVGVLVVFYGIQQRFQSSSDLSQLLTGAALLVIVVIWPGGVWGAICRIWSGLADRSVPLTRLRTGFGREV
jgi:branched-chain amino acid transport system permease protein